MSRGIFVLVMGLASAAMGSPLDGKIGRAERVAIVVVELATHAPKDRRFFYEFVEAAAHAETKNRIKPIYGKVVLLSGVNATLPALQKAMESAANEDRVKAVDMFLHLHGSPGGISLRDGHLSAAKIAETLSAVTKLPAKLRALNSTACWGATHIKDFLAAGFKVASGSRKVNANGAHDTPAFLSNWGKGATYFTAQEKGNDSRWIAFYDKIAGSWGMGAVDSFKEVEGKSDITISDAP